MLILAFSTHPYFPKSTISSHLISSPTSDHCPAYIALPCNIQCNHQEGEKRIRSRSQEALGASSLTIASFSSFFLLLVLTSSPRASTMLLNLFSLTLVKLQSFIFFCFGHISTSHFLRSSLVSSPFPYFFHLDP